MIQGQQMYFATLVETLVFLLISMQIVHLRIEKRDNIFFVLICLITAAITIYAHSVFSGPIRLTILVLFLSSMISFKKNVPLYYSIIGVLFALIFLFFIEEISYRILKSISSLFSITTINLSLIVLMNSILLSIFYMILSRYHLYIIDFNIFSHYLNSGRKYIIISIVISLSIACAIYLITNFKLNQQDIWYIIFILFVFFVFFLRFSMHKKMKILEHEMQKAHEQQLKLNIRNERKTRHDFVFHLNTIYAMADLGEIDELKRYIRGLATNIQLKHQYLPLKEISLSSLLLNYQQTFFHNGIRLNLHLNNSLEGIPLKGYELTIVFANLLVNSFEYLQHDEELKRQIDLTVDFYDSYYRIEVMNEYIGQPEEILTNFLRESKSDLNKTRGLGLSNVNYIVKLYNGQLFPELTSNKMLSMVVIIPI